MDQENHAPIGRSESPREPREARPSLVERVRPPDSPTLGVDLHESIRDALYSAARATRTVGTKGEPDARARLALDVVCELAHRDELRIEQLLVLLKDAWRRIPEVQRVARADADVTLTCCITHCIEAFYRPTSQS